uniref:Uncharacterized protein n=1 Tax=Hyaloperonospora arabidopsidis (strain Emoy2) TaxID=559515 RepID=M4BPL5_HYAAE
MEAVAAVKSVEDDEEDAWVVELEDALDFIGGTSCSVFSATHRSVHFGSVKTEMKEEEEEKESLEEKIEARASVAAILPQEVLALIISFGQVGRVCKSWSLASIAVARRRFSSRLTDILRPVDSNAVMVAMEVEEELYAAYGQRCGELKNWRVCYMKLFNY